MGALVPQKDSATRDITVKDIQTGTPTNDRSATDTETGMRSALTDTPATRSTAMGAPRRSTRLTDVPIGNVPTKSSSQTGTDSTPLSGRRSNAAHRISP